MLEARGCTVRRGDKHLLSDVSATFDAGEVTCLIGQNGAGKTTLLHVLSGDLQPESGQVTLAGSNLSDLGLMEKARCCALMPQKSVLDFPFLVTDVIRMGRFPHSESRPAEDRIVEEMLELLDLEAFRNRHIDSLSGGEQQRVQIARCVAQLWHRLDGAVFLFDEPVASLDLAHQQALFLLLRRLAAEGALVLVSVHDINLAANYGDRICLLKEGALMALGAPAEVVTTGMIQRGFGVTTEVRLQSSGKPGISF